MPKVFQKIPLVLTFIFLGFSCALFVFVYGKINTINNDLQIRETLFKDEAQKREAVKSLEQMVKAIQKERTALESHFAESSDIVPFLDTVESLARLANTKAEVTSVDILDNPSSLLVGIKISGNFDSVYKFITLLENSPYQIEFVSTDIHKENLPDVNGKIINSLNWKGTLRIKLLSFIK